MHIENSQDYPLVPASNVAESDHSTVIAAFEPKPHTRSAKQSEGQLEEEFISTLTSVGYERVNIHSEAQLLANLRSQLERLNNTTFSDDEWTKVLEQHLANAGSKIVDRTRFLQTDPRFSIVRDNGNKANVMVLDKRNLMNNHLQVTNQYVAPADEKVAGSRNSRYDVTVLINGLPMVHIELKRRGVSLREAFHQIDRYQNTSFSTGVKLFEFVQLYVISNGTDTKYYSNTTREEAIKANSPVSSVTKTTSKSFAFTSYWADAENKIISDLIDFAETFMVKRTLLSILTKYCVFDVEENLLVMRPYQIAATEKILTKIKATANQRSLLGTPEAGGYIWHTTGSGKTLTSFKTAQLATEIEGIDKVIFAVDRQDLDYQTVKEYERFQEGSVSSNTRTTVLAAQLGDVEALEKLGDQQIKMTNIIVTTIQKLSTYVRSKKKSERYDGHVVLIFDECHRSQFGKMHQEVARFFNKRHSFGFTGTPIFDETARKVAGGQVYTTESVFGKKLHTYNIIDAINDENVLKFKIDSHSTMVANIHEDGEVKSIDRDSALLADKRIETVVEHILGSFERYTKRDRKKSFVHTIVTRNFKTNEETRTKERINGFNAILATQSIPAAIKYYDEIKKQQKGIRNPLKVAMIFSAPVKQEAADKAAGNVGEEDGDASKLDESSKAKLYEAIADYDTIFRTQFAEDKSSIQNYYKDLAQRVRNRQVDLVVVVNMFLTGFDAPTLNTLYVDKNLQYHGLIQSFSRTNRILNSIKDAGIIVTYRDLSKQTDAALTMYGDPGNVGRVAIVKPYPDLFKDYSEAVEQLKKLAEPGAHIRGEKNKRDFVKLFSQVLKLHNVLSSFEQFDDDNPLTEFALQEYMSRYLSIRDEAKGDYAGDEKEKVDITDDLEFELELVRHISVDIDYIVALIENARDKEHQKQEALDSQISNDDLELIENYVDSSPTLRAKKDLILEFLDKVNGEGFDGDLSDFLQSKFESEVERVISELMLKTPQAYRFIEVAFAHKEVRLDGTDLPAILPPMPLFGGKGLREKKKAQTVAAIATLIEKFGDVVRT